MNPADRTRPGTIGRSGDPVGPGLDLRRVRLEYGDGDETIVALDDVDLVVDRGEVVAVVGPSGSGKSSLLAVAGGLLTPTGGEVRIGGVDLTGLDDRARTRYRRDRIGFVFQSHELIPALTALEQLLLVTHLRGGKPRHHRDRALALLDELGVAHRAGHRPAHLSGGERQRVAVARALMGEPTVILADEPTASLDARRSLEVAGVLVDAAHRHGAATLLVTHDTSIVQLADRVHTMTDGRLQPAP